MSLKMANYWIQRTKDECLEELRKMVEEVEFPERVGFMESILMAETAIKRAKVG